MKTIEKYIAKDLVEFTSKDECISYETLIDRVDNIMSVLPSLPKDDGCSFANGNGYIQHKKEVVVQVWNNLLDEFGGKIEHNWIRESKDMKAHSSYVARLVGDYDIKPYWKAWQRMENIDKQFREWGQPYYANNTDKIKADKMFEL